MQDKKPPPHIQFNPKLSEKARKLRRESKPSERKLWKLLRQNSFFGEAPFNRQKPLGEIIVDFYCHRLKLVIEVDGDNHNSDEARARDARRTQWMKLQGLKVVRFSNKEMNDSVTVMKTLENVIEELREKAP